MAGNDWYVNQFRKAPPPIVHAHSDSRFKDVFIDKILKEASVEDIKQQAKWRAESLRQSIKSLQELLECDKAELAKWEAIIAARPTAKEKA